MQNKISARKYLQWFYDQHSGEAHSGKRNCFSHLLSTLVLFILKSQQKNRIMFQLLFFKNLFIKRAVLCCSTLFFVAVAPGARAMPAPDALAPKSDAPRVEESKNEVVTPNPQGAAGAAGADEDNVESAAAKAPKSAEEKARVAQMQEERRRQRSQREAELRELLMGYGIAERMPQDEIIRYIAHQTQVNEKLQRKGAELYNALRDNSISEDRVYQLLTAYRLTLARNRESRQKDEDQLNERISFRNQPRLAALLELAGIIGDGPLNLPPPDKRADNASR